MTLHWRIKRLAKRLGWKPAPKPQPQPQPKPKPAAKPDPALLIFDATFYEETYPDVADSGLEPYEHYKKIGRAEARNPGPLFDAKWYLETNPDVAVRGVDPLTHFLRSGGKEGRDPVPFGFSSRWYLNEHPELAGRNPLVHYITEGAALGYASSPHFDTAWYARQYLSENAANPLAHYLTIGRHRGLRPSKDGPAEGALELLMSKRFEILEPLRTIPGPSVHRLNLVTDSLGPDTLFGGVATAIILATLWAERTGRKLRIVTRNSPQDASGLGALYESIGLAPTEDPELAVISCGVGDYLEVGDDDVFLTTSWWTTSATAKVIPAERIAYILQEDERAFYPIGTWWLWAQEVMNNPDLAVAINTSGLKEHLVNSGVANLSATAVSFEPSFTSFLKPGRLLAAGEKKKLFFYARPANPRNLYDVGVLAINKAIENGWLDSSEWECHFVGRAQPSFDFCDGSAPIRHESFNWAEYHEFLSEIDLGISLMASPHPSYPPLDLAAGGSVVVTNSWPGKPDLSAASDRIIVAEPTIDALAAAIRDGVAKVSALAEVRFEPGATPFFEPWRENLEPALKHLIGRFDV